jgi:hypothetical protein
MFFTRQFRLVDCERIKKIISNKRRLSKPKSFSNISLGVELIKKINEIKWKHFLYVRKVMKPFRSSNINSILNNASCFLKMLIEVHDDGLV